jgi:hypothetical protein
MAWALLAASSLGSCDAPSGRQPSPYFSLAELVRQESVALQKDGRRLIKKVTAGNKTEERLFENPDWGRELKPFAECDISSPEMTGSYSVDSTVGDHGDSVLVYRARAATMRVDIMEVRFRLGKAVEITAVRETNNQYYRAEQTFVYRPGSGFEITSMQDMIFKDPRTVIIEATFIR